MGLSFGLLLVLQQPLVILDGHIDTPQRMLDMRTDISARLADGHVDVPRMKEGGLTAAFFSIWVDARYRRGGGVPRGDRERTRLESSHQPFSYFRFFFLKKKKNNVCDCS